MSDRILSTEPLAPPLGAIVLRSLAIAAVMTYGAWLVYSASGESLPSVGSMGGSSSGSAGGSGSSGGSADTTADE